MIDKLLTSFPDPNIFCSKCGTKLETYTEVERWQGILESRLLA